jgi:hypothetical protein
MPAQRCGLSGKGAGAGHRLGVCGSRRSADVRSLGSRERIGAAASHCEDVSRWVGVQLVVCWSRRWVFEDCNIGL